MERKHKKDALYNVDHYGIVQVTLPGKLQCKNGKISISRITYY